MDAHFSFDLARALLHGATEHQQRIYAVIGESAKLMAESRVAIAESLELLDRVNAEFGVWRT
jgi:hypothetical protein